MPNIFDQFDSGGAGTAPAGPNVFDRFDAPAGAPARAPEPSGGPARAQAAPAAQGPDVGRDLLKATAGPVLGADERGSTPLGPLVRTDGGDFYQDAGGNLRALSNQDFIGEGPDGNLFVFAREATGGPMGAARKLSSAVIPGMVAGAPAGIARRGAPVLTQGQDVAAAAERQNIPVTLPTVSDSRVVRGTAGVAREVPVAGGFIERGIARESGAIAGRTEDVAARAGAARTADEAGRTAREGLEGFRAAAGKEFNLREASDETIKSFIVAPARKSSFSQKAAALYERVARSIPQGAAGEASSTRATLDAIRGRFDSPQLAAQFENSFIGRLSESLQGAQSWGDLRQVRTEIRGLRARELSDAERTIGNAEIKRIEAGLTEDIYRITREAAGEAALKSLQRADRFYAAGTTRLDAARDLLKVRSDEALFNRIADLASSRRSADIKRLNQVRRSLGDDAFGDVAAVVIRNLGKPTPGASDVADFSIGSFVTNYAKLSDKGKNALFSGSGRGDLKSALDDLAKVAAGAKRTARFSVPTGGGKGVGRTAAFGTILAAGFLDAWTTAIVAVAGVTGAAAFMASPKIVRALTRLGRAQVQAGNAPRVATELARMRQALADDPNFAQFADALVARFEQEGQSAAQDGNQ